LSTLIFPCFFGRHELTIKSIVKSGRLAVRGVIATEEREEEECVGKEAGSVLRASMEVVVVVACHVRR
jgi:hypothetical protein